MQLDESKVLVEYLEMPTMYDERLQSKMQVGYRRFDFLAWFLRYGRSDDG